MRAPHHKPWQNIFQTAGRPTCWLCKSPLLNFSFLRKLFWQALSSSHQMGCIYTDPEPKDTPLWVWPQPAGRYHLKPGFSHLSDITTPRARLFGERDFPAWENILQTDRQLGGFHCVCHSCLIFMTLTQRQKRCSLTESLWKLGLGSVHSLLNLWDKCVLTTTTCKLHSLFFFQDFPLWRWSAHLQVWDTLYYSWVPLGSELWWKSHERSLLEYTREIRICKGEGKKDEAEGKLGCSKGPNTPEKDLRSWRDIIFTHFTAKVVGFPYGIVTRCMLSQRQACSRVESLSLDYGNVQGQRHFLPLEESRSFLKGNLSVA